MVDNASEKDHIIPFLSIKWTVVLIKQYEGLLKYAYKEV